MNIVCNRLTRQQESETSGAHVQLIKTRNTLMKGKPQGSEKLQSTKHQQSLSSRLTLLKCPNRAKKIDCFHQRNVFLQTFDDSLFDRLFDGLMDGLTDCLSV